MTFSEWIRVFPDTDFRFQMAIRSGVSTFWHRSNPALEHERRWWIERHPARYTGCVSGNSVLVEAGLLELSNLACVESADFKLLSWQVEPDWMLVEKSDSDWVVVAGSVVFPSSWGLDEKLGRSVSEIHDPVPGLNSALGISIRMFLDRLKHGQAWERWNWGLSADAELNHHPGRLLQGLSAGCSVNEVWVRLENQRLERLACGLVLFGIRVVCHPLGSISSDPILAGRILKALETMPDEVAMYKGLLSARLTLVAALRVAAGRS